MVACSDVNDIILYKKMNICTFDMRSTLPQVYQFKPSDRQEPC